MWPAEPRFSVAARGFWIGVEAMPTSVLHAATKHEWPIFCGQLPLNKGLQAQLSELNARAEWHDVALGTPIGQGYLMDLLRRRLPVDNVALALDVSVNDGQADGQFVPLDELLARVRRIVETLLVVTRGAEATIPSGSGALTVLLIRKSMPPEPLTEGLAAFVEQFVSAEAARWAVRGRSLRIERADSCD